MGMREMQNVRIAATPATKVSAHSMVVALVRSGCDLESNFHYKRMDDTQKAAVRAELGL